MRTTTVLHGFVYRNGTYTAIEDPLASVGGPLLGTLVTAINDLGEVAGIYSSPALNGKGFVSNGFVYSNGTYTTIDDPFATRGTFVTAINFAGEVTGYYVTGQQAHGFTYSNGIYTTINGPTVTISGRAQEGQTLRATANVGVHSYQWQALIGSTWTDISGATRTTYVVGEDVEGERLRVVATLSHSGGLTLPSGFTKPVVDVTPGLSVTLAGVAQEGKLLTATPLITTDADGGGSIAYQWQELIGGKWGDIAGAANASYMVAEADEGHELRVSAIFTDETGLKARAVSSATAAVTDAPPTPTSTNQSMALMTQFMAAMGGSGSTGLATSWLQSAQNRTSPVLSPPGH